MKNIKYIKLVIALCLSMIVIISCDWQDPLPSILDNRTGTYTNTDDDFTVIIAADATSLQTITPCEEYEDTDDADNTVTISMETNEVALYGGYDTRLDIPVTTDIKITFHVDKYDELYLYTNYSSDTSNYSTCTKQ